MQRRYYEKQLSRPFWANVAPVTLALRFDWRSSTVDFLMPTEGLFPASFDAKFDLVATSFPAESVHVE